LALLSLMQLAANKYKNLFQLKKWNAPTGWDIPGTFDYICQTVSRDKEAQGCSHV
jgi:hypothetical protein